MLFMLVATMFVMHMIMVAFSVMFVMMVVAVLAIWYVPALVTYLPGQMKL